MLLHSALYLMRTGVAIYKTEAKKIMRFTSLVFLIAIVALALDHQCQHAHAEAAAVPPTFAASGDGINDDFVYADVLDNDGGSGDESQSDAAIVAADRRQQAVPLLRPYN